MKKKYSLFFSLFFVLSQCTHQEQPALMELLPSQYTHIDFSNALDESEDLNLITFEYFYNGAGVGIGDFNNDGLQDIFFAANMRSNRLYLNKGSLTFEDITQSAGLSSSGKWATGVSLVDINQDGWLDIYVCYAGPYTASSQRANELYINNGNLTFSEKASAYGLADTGHSVQAAFFDYDQDGDLDVYLLTNITDQTGPNVIRSRRLKGEMENTDRLYRNNGDFTFSNVSAAAGITAEGYGLGVSICDLNKDGWPDVYVSNDYLSNDLLYINNQDGTFTDRLAHYFQHTSYSAMGNDVADYNNDGLLDVMAVDMLPPDNQRQKMMFGATNYDRYRSEMQYGYTPQFMRNTLQLNAGMYGNQPVFSEIGQLAGIEASDWSWSPLFADMDNDGWKDLLITNGYARDITNRDFVSYRMQEFLQQGDDVSVKKKWLHALQSIEGPHLPIVAFKNKEDLTFSNVSFDWGFHANAYSTGAAYADLDNDGDLDYVTNNIDAPAFIYKNNAERNGHHFLQVKLYGPPGNRNGYGAQVSVYMDSTLQYQELSPYRGYQSSVQQALHFGVGPHTTIDSLLVVWPDGKQQRLNGVASDQFISITYSDTLSSKVIPSTGHADSSVFRDAIQKRNIHYKHQETEYADFKIEPLLPHKYSENGPGIAVGDVNGDGLEDFFIGGAYNQSGQFFLQHANGKFSTQPLTHQTKYEEDMGVLLFDADCDRDNDLYITGGGNEFAAGSVYYQDHLYINDGKGNFKKDERALPALTSSGSCVIAADYDRDGDLDLFVGGRLTPHHYPKPGQSAILQNDGGHFSDVTQRVAPGLQQAGMVTSALWSDVDNDNSIDLIVVGEWMPVTIFKNKDGHFQSSTLPNSIGWWNSIQAADFDEDGDIDYVLGNLGLNTRYKTSEQQPVSVYTDDFNSDGTMDALLSYYVQGVNRPASPRDDLFLQMPQFKKKYPSYQLYSQATLESLLEGITTKPMILKSHTFQSSYLENKLKNGWELRPLPIQAQVAPVFGVVTGDFDDDGHVDAILSGNSYASDVLTGRYDALKGLFLKGDGRGGLTPLPVAKSGVLINGNAKGLSQLSTADGRILLLAALNNDTLLGFESQGKSQLLPIRNQEVSALLTKTDGKTYRQEFYFGSGYLSQSSRHLQISKFIARVSLTDVHGKIREVKIK